MKQKKTEGKFRFRGLQFGIIILVLGTQLLTFRADRKQRGDYEGIVDMVNALDDAGQILYFYNRASIAFQEAQMFFNFYLEGKDEELFGLYQESVREMTLNLDSLDKTIGDKTKLGELMEKHNDLQLQIGFLKQNLDGLVGQATGNAKSPLVRHTSKPMLDVQGILGSIVYDTLRTPIAPETVASGSSSTPDKRAQGEILDIIVTMNYGNRVVVGSFEDQISYLLGLSRQTIQGSLSQTKQAYLDFRLLDEKLLETNQEILSLNNQFLAEYNMLYSQVQEKYRKTLDTNLEAYRARQDTLSNFLFVVFLLAAAALFLFLVRNFRYQAKLEKANETISENLLAKDKLINLISHDIRTPLNLISIYSGQLKKKYSDLDRVEKFQLLQYTANNSLLLSNQILQLANSEGTEVVLENKSANLKGVLMPILKTLTTLTEENGNVFELECMVPDDIIVKIDQGKIFRLFYNLVGNANSYTRNGTVNVKLELVEAENGFLLKSKVQDNGIGIEESFLDKLFDPYSKVERAGQFNHFGVGLGLYLCKQIVDLYRGNVKIESKVGAGTTVFFELQLETASPPKKVV